MMSPVFCISTEIDDLLQCIEKELTLLPIMLKSMGPSLKSR